METQGFKVHIEFLSEILGSQPASQDIRLQHLAKRSGIALPEMEDELLPDLDEKGKTVFYRMPEGAPALAAYQVKGFLKDAAQAFNGKVTGNVKNLRSKIERYVFFYPRFAEIVLPPGGEMDICERPLRAETARGPRVALAALEDIGVQAVGTGR